MLRYLITVIFFILLVSSVINTDEYLSDLSISNESKTSSNENDKSQIAINNTNYFNEDDISSEETNNIPEIITTTTSSDIVSETETVNVNFKEKTKTNEFNNINTEETTSSFNDVNNEQQNEQWKNTTQKRPHIIFILADDMGWNDISYHGSGEFLTPNIDALAYNGIQLHRMYAMHVCTPSRAALMTGYHPIHIGMQHKVIYGEEPRGLPLHLKILPQYLNDLGYDSHIVGKWHLGWWKKVYTPLYRGFKSHLGFWTGHHHYFDHWAREWKVGGLDMRRDMEPAWDLTGKYTTDILTNKSVEIIENHNSEDPLFLYIAHAACHSADPNDTMPVPEQIEKKFSYIANIQRRKFAATTWIMDESVGRVVKALEDNNMLENSLIVFSSDNGGAAGGFNLNMASNWPLKGVKNTLWEGGVRVSALMWSPHLEKQQRVAHQYMHFSDWLPTLYHAAGGNVTDLGNIDGINIWPALSNDSASPRTEILHNIDEDFENAALTIDQWKIMAGTMYKGDWDKWYGPSGRNISGYNFNAVRESLAGKSLRSIGFDVSIEKMKKLRNEANIKPNKKYTNSPCNLVKEVCLFNVIDDPLEMVNLAPRYPQIVEKMLNRLEQIRKTAVPPNNKELDKRADPKYFNWVWTNFGDYLPNENVSSAEYYADEINITSSNETNAIENNKQLQKLENSSEEDEITTENTSDESGSNATFRKFIQIIQNGREKDKPKIIYFNKTYIPSVVSMNQKVYPTIMFTSDYEEVDLDGRRYLDIPDYDETIDESELHDFEKKMRKIYKQ